MRAVTTATGRLRVPSGMLWVWKSGKTAMPSTSCQAQLGPSCESRVTMYLPDSRGWLLDLLWTALLVGSLAITLLLIAIARWMHYRRHWRAESTLVVIGPASTRAVVRSA